MFRIKNLTVKKDFLGEVILDKFALKKEIIKKYQELINLTDKTETEITLKEIHELENKL